MQRFGENIKKLRKGRGWNQTTLGEKAGGINVETINRIEHGQNTTTDKLYRIAAAFEVPIGELLPEDERAIVENGHPICPDNDPDHIYYHEAAELVLHSGNEVLINAMAFSLEAAASQLDGFSPDEPPNKKQHGPFLPDASLSLDDKTRARHSKRKVRRKPLRSTPAVVGNGGE